MSKTAVELNGETILVTGSPGFIGANLVLRLMHELSGGIVISLDNMNDYYDPLSGHFWSSQWSGGSVGSGDVKKGEMVPSMQVGSGLFKEGVRVSGEHLY